MFRNNYLNRGKLGISNSKGLDPNLKIVDGKTGIVYDSPAEAARKKQLLEEGIDFNQEEFEDPYITLLKGMQLMNDYFQNKEYYVTVEPEALLTLEEIRQGGSADRLKINQEGFDFIYVDEIKTFLPLMEILKIRSLRYRISLTRKEDIFPLYKELKYLERVTDYENYPSYNRLPTSPEILNEIKNLIQDLEKTYTWLLDTPLEEPTLDLVEKNFGTIATMINDLNQALSNVKGNNFVEGQVGDFTEQIQNNTRYRKRT